MVIGNPDILEQSHAHNAPDLWDRGSINTTDVTAVVSNAPPPSPPEALLCHRDACASVLLLRGSVGRSVGRVGRGRVCVISVYCSTVLYQKYVYSMMSLYYSSRIIVPLSIQVPRFQISFSFPIDPESIAGFS